ncbi:MAG TPA: 2-oxoacid:ferredoxin oxidoreductase subunit beta [Candidatus Marinimicrobia bacterium]|jgi:2-oxoglutarate ferredoxin oxidoreductase subunit beta|nr:2-oxoacid:ferredoxin oxidoreductase subunit beta [Candidatus Neomarinimicrobiota bacterium]|tara:strand:- start:6113 stop:7129 length:1017 start_codon:yes stop_codon:yes gene_type:complete
MSEVSTITLSKKDFISDQDVRWCPGCGDYAILSQVQKVFPNLGIPKENFLVVSGIGCSSRFPYYLDTFGFHSIHGRAPALATGAKIANPDLSVWIVTGDGDSMSIGGNHFIHVLRRNFDLNILLFNNQVYGLTKGQYSPTSEIGRISNSTPFGSVDYPFNPPLLALGAGGTFIARGIDREQKHLQGLLYEAYKHKGTSLVEIYQNCWVFNDGAFASLTDREIKMETQLILENGKPMIFGRNQDKGLMLKGSKLEVISLTKKNSINKVMIHDEQNKIQGLLLSELTYDKNYPTPMGVLYREEKPTYETMLHNQLATALKTRGKGDLDKLFNDSHTWEVE